MDPTFDYQFRLILIGDTTVGKSSLLRYFTDGKFLEVSDPTVGVDFFARHVTLQDGTKVKLQLWDTAGQERFRSITTSYYRHSVGALLCYSITDRHSFLKIPTWLAEAKRHMCLTHNNPTPATTPTTPTNTTTPTNQDRTNNNDPVFAILGCKSDLEERAVTMEDAQALVASLGIPSSCVYETSAATGCGVQEAFQGVAEEVSRRVRKGDWGNLNNTNSEWEGIKVGGGRGGGFVRVVPEGFPERSKCC